MRLAWFRPTLETPVVGDDLATVIAALSTAHAIDIIDQARAHDFVWQQARRPYDLCVFELDDTAAHAYIWPYLLHYPGVLALRTATLHASRTTTLMHRPSRRDYDAEMRFSEGAPRTTIAWHVTQGTWPMLRVPALASRLVAVADADWAEALVRAHPAARVRYVPVGVASPTREGTGARGAGRREGGPRHPDAMRVAVVDGCVIDVVDRAIARAWTAAAPIERSIDTGTTALGRDAHVAVALGRPALGVSVAAALAGMAAGVPVIVAEAGATAAWPALDPHTWQPRGYGGGYGGGYSDGSSDGYSDTAPPAVISIDPRDEEHSLMLAFRRLASDAALHQRLGDDGHRWWAAHHTPSHAIQAWDALLREAVTLAPPSMPEEWPAHLTDDGTALARQLVSELGLDFDTL